MTVAFNPAGLKPSALVLAGGIGMGAFAAGAYAAMDQAGLAGSLGWTAGSSIGAVTACLIAGNPPGKRVARLRQFWDGVASDPTPLLSFWFGAPPDGPWRQACNQLAVWQTLLLGRPGLFRPRLAPAPRAGVQDVPALYDLEPLRERLAALIDFDRLNRGPMRVTIAATEVVTGHRLAFDTGKGCVLTPDHILASCALLPLFAPIEIEGRLLGDGGLSSNAPLDLVLTDPAARDMQCYVVDLFAAEGSRPSTLASGASRAGDLAFGNQTARLLEAQAREGRLRQVIARLGARLTQDQRAEPDIAAAVAEGRGGPADIVVIAYRAGLDEAGLGKPFDFSRATIADRWQAGQDQMSTALLENVTTREAAD